MYIVFIISKQSI